MQDILSESLRRLKEIRIRRNRMVAVLLALSLLVSFDVFWLLRQPGWTLAGDADCKITEHTHDDGCIAECSIPEHIHTIECYSDETVDAETQLDWQKMFEDYPYTQDLAKDLVGIAKTQVGYAESSLNFEVDDYGVRRGYTRYGAWYGAPYSDWSATFVSFCLNYAGADLNEYPINTGASAMAEQWKALGRYAAKDEYTPKSGDLVFFSNNTVGIVAEVQTTTCYVIRGDMENSVQTSIVSFADESIVGWGTVSKRVLGNSFSIANKNLSAQNNNLLGAENLQSDGADTPIDLPTYLNGKEGDYSFTLLDTNHYPIPKDANGHYILHANTEYIVVLTISSPEGFENKTYQYQFPDGMLLDSEGYDDIIKINDTIEAGDWNIEDGTLTLNFDNVNNLSDVVINVTMGVVFPDANQEIDFDGKISVTVELPREEIKETELKKWGVQNPEIDDKIFWTATIEGNQHSNIPGSKLTDKAIKHDWSYEHHYTAEDMANGLTFGVSYLEDGAETWHSWTVYPGEDLVWTETGWEYTMPEIAICDKNPNSPHEVILGNDNYTYYVEYTSTPTHVDIAGEIGYVNAIEIDNQRVEGWAGFTHNVVNAALYKHGTLVTDANGAKIVWEIQATIPKRDPDKEGSAHDWIINDNMILFNQYGGKVYERPNDMNLATITANYFGTVINVPNLRVATENDPYAYETYLGTIHILQRCDCNENTCGEWDGKCNPWGYWVGSIYYPVDYCDCWRETEDTTFTITYETDATEDMKNYGGLGYTVVNTVQMKSSTTTLNTNASVSLPGVIKKQDQEPDGTIVKYNVTVNEAKLNLTDGSSLFIYDEMSETLAFMRGSLFIKAVDEAGTEVLLQEDVDYVYTYNDPEDLENHPGRNVLKVEILHPQPVTYVLDYNTMLIMETGSNKPVSYDNSAYVTLWGQDISAVIPEKVQPYLSVASNAFKVFVHKLSETGDSLQGAKFGLYNDRGGLIAVGTTDKNGKAYFETDIKNGVVLREHKVYYLQELEAPEGYKLDDTKHKFTFCNKKEGTCDVFAELDQEHDLERVKFEDEGHIDVTNEILTYDLPETGGIGVYPIILTSVIFIITPLVYRFIRRRKRERRGDG